MELNTIYHGDCLELMKDIPDKSIDLILTDPPYNINKAKWDTWKNTEEYVNWLGSIFKECERVLKDNGSFYFFHNDFLQMVEIQNWINKNTKFVFKQLIVWNKKFKGANNEGYLQGYNEIENLRNYQKMAEYCLYYTFQDETRLSTVMLDVNNFQTLRNYFKDVYNYISINKKQIIFKIGQKADHCFRYNSTQWDLPTEETYNELITIFKINKYVGFREYESLRQEYESLRYIFNNQKTHHSVWNYDIAKKEGHITPKPIDLIENILYHSSNEGMTILDPFLGSGTTAIACINTGRNFIGIEKDEEYFNIAQKRVKEAQGQRRLDL